MSAVVPLLRHPYCGGSSAMHGACRMRRIAGAVHFFGRRNPPTSRRALSMALFARSFLAFALATFGFSAIASAAPDASPEGYWLTEKKSGIVQIFRCWGGSQDLCGKLVWFRLKPEDHNPNGVDLLNADPAQRNRPLCGLMFMYGFKAA